MNSLSSIHLLNDEPHKSRRFLLELNAFTDEETRSVAIPLKLRLGASSDAGGELSGHALVNNAVA
jgi:hypothetical protein